MKLARSLVKTIFYIFLLFTVIIYSSIIYLDYSLSEEFKIKKGGTLNFDYIIPVTAEYNGSQLSQSKSLSTVGNEFEVDLKVFGVIPLSTVSVQVVDELQVAVLGTPFGMKLYTEGVLVIDLTEVESTKGRVSPAKLAGIKKGDYILSVDGQNIYSNEDLSAIVEKSKGKEMRFLIKRNGKNIYLNVSAVLSSETESYKLGIWIRDSSAGIGTLTFYSPANDVLCGLGHGICDEDTGDLLELNSGEIVTAEILSVEKGSVGSPGQLKGKFGFKTLGNIDNNCDRGIYSVLKGSMKTDELIEIALKQEISDGQAQILSTIEGDTPKLYSCKIKVRPSSYHSKTQNMIVTVTDKDLLESTGGIVQGMSGSPIIQNGKLIGAVTHVLVDDPTSGYAIFAENMLEIAHNVAEEEQLKEAS